MGAVSLSVEAIAGVTCADDSSEVISALLLTGRRCAHIHACRERERERRQIVRGLSMLKLSRITV